MNIQCLPSDIISTMPQNVIEMILTLMPIRDAVRTSILSRKWRYNWVKIPKLVFDDKLFDGSTNNNQLLGNHKHFFAINQVLLLHQGPILDFTLRGMGVGINSVEIYQIILLLSRNTTLKKFTLRFKCHYKLPSSFFSLQQLTHLNLMCCELPPTSSFYSLQQLTHLDLQDCLFRPPSTFNGFNMLTSLSFDNVLITDDKVHLRLISGYPFLKHFDLCGFHMISGFQEESGIVDQLFKSLNVIVYLNLSYYSTKWPFAGDIPRKPPTSFVHLKHLDLSGWYLMKEADFCLTLLLIKSSPNLEKFKIQYNSLEVDDEMEETVLFDVLQDYADVRLDHLIEFEIKYFSNSIAESELLKLILVKSPMLKKVHLKIDEPDVASDKEEIKALRSLLRLPRASPVAEIVVQSN